MDEVYAHSPPRPWRWLPVLAWIALLWYLSDQSRLPLINNPFVMALFAGLQGPIAHAVAWAVLAGLARWALEGTRHANLVAWILAAGFGLLDEIHQAATPGRQVQLLDWLLDMTGAYYAVRLVSGWIRRQRERPPRRGGHP